MEINQLEKSLQAFFRNEAGRIDEKALHEGVTAFNLKQPGNPYDESSEYQQWVCWNTGWLQRLLEEQKKAYAKGLMAHKLGHSSEDNEYSPSDSITNPKNSLHDHYPQIDWIRGWVSERRKAIEEYRKSHQEEIQDSFQELKLLEASWKEHAGTAFTGNIFRHGLSYLKSKRVIKQINKTLTESEPARILERGCYLIAKYDEGWDLADMLDQRMKQYVSRAWKKT